MNKTIKLPLKMMLIWIALSMKKLIKSIFNQVFQQTKSAKTTLSFHNFKTVKKATKLKTPKLEILSLKTLFKNFLRMVKFDEYKCIKNVFFVNTVSNTN